MNNLTEFKQFVKDNPSLVKYVKSGEMNWQKFYEMYDLYGQNNEIWNDYISVKNDNVSVTEKPISSLALSDLITWFKTMDVDKMQEGINSFQRVISVLQDLGNNNQSTTTSEYKPRPVYKHFED